MIFPPAAPMETVAPIAIYLPATQTSMPGAPHLLGQQLHGHRAGHRIRWEGLRPARDGTIPLHRAWEAVGGGEAEIWSQRLLPLPRRHGEPGVALAGGTDSPSSSREAGAFSPAA